MKSLKNEVKILYIISIGLFFAFFVKTYIDYTNYNSIINSAPFSVWVMVNTIYFIVPSVILLIMGYFINKKNNKK